MGFIVNNVLGLSEEDQTLNADDFRVNDVLSVTAINGQNHFVGVPAGSLSGISRVDYYYVRAILTQDNTISSGKCKPTITETGEAFGNCVNGYSLTASTKASTGVYDIQFTYNSGKTWTPDLATNLNRNSAVERVTRLIYDVGDISGTAGPMGWLVYPTNNTYGNFDFDSAKVRAETFDLSWNHADDILMYGVPIELKIFIYPGLGPTNV